MAEISSKGTYGLSHFSNSRAAMENYEPAYLNKFTVSIALPSAIGSTNENTNLVLENVQKVGGLDTEIIPTTPVEQYYKFAARRFAGGKPDKTTVDITLDFEVNLQYTSANEQPSAYVLRTLRMWQDLIYDPLTGREGLKKDYIAPWMTVTVTDRADTPFWQWKFKNIFPITHIPAIELDYQSNDIYKITGWTLACDFWDESMA